MAIDIFINECRFCFIFDCLLPFLYKLRAKASHFKLFRSQASPRHLKYHAPWATWRSLSGTTRAKGESKAEQKCSSFTMFHTKKSHITRYGRMWYNRDRQAHETWTLVGFRVSVSSALIACIGDAALIAFHCVHKWRHCNRRHRRRRAR